MTEIRIDALSGLRTIIVARPGVGSDLAVIAQPTAPTADEPCLHVEPVLRHDAPDPPPQDDPGLFEALAARGSHEVIATDPGSARSLAELSDEQAKAAVEVWRERMRVHDAASYVHLSVDEGPDAGHPHATLHAMDFVPAAVARERERFSAYAVRTMGANLLEDLVAEEVRRRERIVAIDNEAVLWCPYASAQPYQLMLAPRRRRERFEDDGPSGAGLLHRGLRLLRERFEASPPLSLWIRTAPRDADRFCWRIDIVPRLRPPAGLELGTGVACNPVAPERAACELRGLAR